jgi:hypothetical protein
MAEAAKIHKLESQLAEITKEKSELAKELNRIRELNRKGDAELQKAVNVLNRSKEAQHLSLIMDERDTYQQQVSLRNDVYASLSLITNAFSSSSYYSFPGCFLPLTGHRPQRVASI